MFGSVVDFSKVARSGFADPDAMPKVADDATGADCDPAGLPGDAAVTPGAVVNP